MSRNKFTESDAEEAALEILGELGYERVYGPDIAPDGTKPERGSYAEVVLVGRLRSALAKLNPDIAPEFLDEAVRKVLRQESQSLVANNEAFHKMLVEGGAEVQVKRKDGTFSWERVKLVDFENPESNDWLAVNQFTIEENRENRRPDIVLFVNGLPLGLVELKNPASETATVDSAYNQLQTYKQLIPSIFRYNEVLVASDGVSAKYGTITSCKEWFLPWKTLNGKPAPKGMPQLEVLFQGVFDKKRFLDIVRNFIVFEHGRTAALKKMAAYHQYNAVNEAVKATLKASGERGDKRCGVVWHTQGSGKSLSMVFYVGKLVQAMNNPTLVVLTDRNDLDDQLFGTFSRCQSLLRQAPKQPQGREELRELLKVASGGVVFTTIQKFLPEQKGGKFPLLTDRRNIIVIADEAHRSQYDFIDGFARHMRDALPNASFIGFTGTPIEKSDRSTRMVFGDYVHTYDIQQAVEDGATVKIYYEPRLAKLELKPEERPRIDPEFEDVTEGEEVERKEKLKSKWARVEALVGSEKRVRLIAKDLVDHFEQRRSVLEGKGMVVCMSRRICVQLYKEIIKLRPDWHADADDRGFVKVVMTGSASDPVDWQPHIRNKQRREALADHFKDAGSPFGLAIVRDMWLTGFDAPSLHTLYVDKPMHGHGLMQAIARVNRVFKDKPGGLVVDYLGIAEWLKAALSEYTATDRQNVGIEQGEAVALMLEKYEVAKAMLHGFNYSPFFTGTSLERLSVIPAAMEHVLKQQDGSKRFTKTVYELSKAFALAVPSEEALKIRDDVQFFQALRANLVKTVQPSAESKEELDSAIQQIVSKAIVPEKVVDLYALAGLRHPDISILSEEFLADVRSMQHKNLAVELLRKLLNDEIKTRFKKNVVQTQSFAELLEKAIRKYQNRAIQTVEVIEELIGLAKKMREAVKRVEKLGLTEDEIAFYDALETNDSAVKVLGDEKLRQIARDVAVTVRNNTTIDWALKESTKANLRVMVKRVLRKYGYPPDKQEKTTKTVLEQAEEISKQMTDDK